MGLNNTRTKRKSQDVVTGLGERARHSKAGESPGVGNVRGDKRPRLTGPGEECPFSVRFNYRHENV